MKHVIVATQDGCISYLCGSTSKALSGDLLDAAQYANAKNATQTVKDLRKLGFETKRKVRLSIAPLIVKIGAQVEIKDEPKKTGFVLHRMPFKFYTGPRKAKADFSHAHYRWGAVEAATVFLTRAEAEAKIVALKAELDETAFRMRDAVYTKIKNEFEADVVTTDDAYSIALN
jgi:hypothetical protein